MSAGLIRAGGGEQPDDPALADLRAAPERLAAVERSQLLDSPPEEAFDALTRLAALLLKAPASFVAVVDDTRDFYKSQFGFPPTLASERQKTGRTFCHYTLDRAEPLAIDDTHAEPQWRAVPTVGTMGVRAYLGVPLQYEGQNIGSFCVIDNQPRRWTDTEREAVSQLALSATRELGLREALSRAREDAARSRELALSREKVLAVVVHDLRSPLQVLGLSAEALRRQADPAQAQLSQRILNSTQALRSLIDQLLVDSVAGSTAPSRRERIAAATLLRDAADAVGVIAARSGIDLRLGDLPQGDVRVDYAQLLRVFGNLIGNAVKYCPAGSHVVLSGADDGDQVLLRVSDDGPGLADADQARVFDAGWQGADGLVRTDGSGGLGLAIVRRLVEHHGGTVAIAGPLGQGTTVSVRLPRL